MSPEFGCYSTHDRRRKIVEVRDAALVGRRDLAVEHDLTAELSQIGEYRAEVPAALIGRSFKRSIVRTPKRTRIPPML